MEQEIGFCTTSDGVSIAYAAISDGEQPIVYANGWPTQLDAEWEAPQARGFLEAMAEGCTLIRYDMRGTGLSEKGISDFSLPALVRDLEAVVDHLDLSKFDLLGLGGLGGPVAMTYAAANPSEINRLILKQAFVRGGELLSPERQEAQIEYVSKFGYPQGALLDDPDIDIDAQRDIRSRLEEAGPPEVQAALFALVYSIDLSELLNRLTIPTLVIHARQDESSLSVPFAQGRELAARLPKAKLVSLEGSSMGALAHQEIVVRETRSFLGLQVKRHSEPSADTHTILFTDIASSTALAQQHGDAKAQEVRRAHNNIVRAALAANGGAEIKHTGDGIMASFSSASSALECAVAIQRGVAKHKDESPDSPLQIYIGLNAGEPIAEEDDLFGTSVDLAQRICDHAEQGQILASDVVRQLAAGKDFLFSDLGETELRGFEDPVKLWELRWPEQG